MARYKDYSYDQTKLLPVSYDKQILPGTFEYALNTIINEMDLSIFSDRYHNDETGAPAYDPAILLKIILFAYSRGIINSREIARACKENVTFMALSADTHPHFTTIADFISSLQKAISEIFSSVLAVCSSEGLIGKNMFAVDGCKISSNCSKEWSGTRADFEKKKQKLDKSINLIIRKHRQKDELELDNELIEKEKVSLKRLRQKVSKVNEWLEKNEDKKGSSGVIQSNITDNETAKMPSNHGVVQGYNGQAMVDGKHQIIVHAEVSSDGNDRSSLKSMIDGTRDNFKKIGEKKDVFDSATLLADAGYHSEQNMEHIYKEEIDAYIADNQFRKRDPQFETQGRHKKSVDRKHTPLKNIRTYFTAEDFTFDESTGKLICPAGNHLYLDNSKYVNKVKGVSGKLYRGCKTSCRTCKLRLKCIRGEKTEHRTVLISNKEIFERGHFTKQMIERFDTAEGRFIYSRRLGIVEPVFAHLRNARGFTRFTVRSRIKADIQWKLISTVHNLFKIFRFAPKFAS